MTLKGDISTGILVLWDRKWPALFEHRRSLNMVARHWFEGIGSPNFNFPASETYLMAPCVLGLVPSITVLMPSLQHYNKVSNIKMLQKVTIKGPGQSM